VPAATAAAVAVAAATLFCLWRRGVSCARLRWCLVCVCLTGCDGVGRGCLWRMLDDAVCDCDRSC
jgi:hypothetical protein